MIIQLHLNSRAMKRFSFDAKLKVIFVVSWIGYLIISLASILLVGQMVQSLINQQLAVSPNSDLFDLWQNPPINPKMKVYLFNVTNSNEWLKGKDHKIKVNEIGPYVFEETWIKEDVSFHQG